MDDWLKQRVKSLALQLLALVRNSNGVILILNFFFKKKIFTMYQDIFLPVFALAALQSQKKFYDIYHRNIIMMYLQ